MSAALGRWLRGGAVRARALAGRIPPLAILLAGGAFVLVYSFPGYMNWDSAGQLGQARVNAYDDWHPPLMARYWHFTEKLVTGALPLLVLQIGLFLWGMHGLLKRRFSSRVAAVMTVAVLVFPPVIATFAPVWKDSQMVGFLLAGFMLLFGESRTSRVAGCVVLFFAAGVRDNAVAALPPLLLVAVASWGFRHKLVVCAVAFALFCVIGGGARKANVKLTDGRAVAWVKTNAIHDIAGTICLADPMTDEQVLKELDGIPLKYKGPDLQKRFCEQYNPRWWFPLSFGDKALFEAVPGDGERAAREAAYFRLIKKYPGAFLKHRWNVSRELLGLGKVVPDEPVCQTFAGTPGQAFELKISEKLSWVQLKLGQRYAKDSTTLLFRPWAYALVGLFLALYAIWKRDGLVLALIASGYLYELSFMVAAAGAPFRYSNWMISCVCVATLIVFGERVRAGLQARGKAGGAAAA